MAVKTVPWVGGYAKHDSLDVSSQESINYYVEVLEADGVKSQTLLRGIPGSQLWKDIGVSGVCRGMHTSSDGQLYVCYGAKIYHIASNKAVTEIINIGSGASKVSMASNSFVLMVCDGQGMWSINLTTQIATSVTLTGFTNPKQVVYFGNRFVCICNDKSYAENELDNPLDAVVLNDNKFFYSTLNDPSEWLALSYEVAATGADPITAIAVSGNELWVYGENSYEPWRYTGDSIAPYEKAQGAGGWIGCYNKDSVVSIGNKVFWLGSGINGFGQIWTNGSTYEPAKISNLQIDQLLARTRNSGITLSDAVAWSYSEIGHTFYVISFINGNFTLAYDLTTGKWGVRSSRHPTLGSQERWNYMYSASAYDKVFVADERNPYIMQLSSEIYDEYTNVPAMRLDIRRLHRGPIYFNDNSPFIINEFMIDMETGVGNSVGQGVNPMMMLRVSKDGHTFQPERLVPIGKVGEYRTTVRIRSLGMAKNFVIESVVTDPVRTTLISARIDADQTSKR